MTDVFAVSANSRDQRQTIANCFPRRVLLSIKMYTLSPLFIRAESTTLRSPHKDFANALVEQASSRAARKSGVFSCFARRDCVE